MYSDNRRYWKSQYNHTSACKDNARRVKKLGTYSKHGHSLPEIIFIIRSSTHIRRAIKARQYNKSSDLVLTRNKYIHVLQPRLVCIYVDLRLGIPH